MGTRISLPDPICLNEIRIAKESVATIPVRKCFFDPEQRRVLGRSFRESGYIPVFSEPDCVFLMRTKEKIGGKLPEGVNLVEDNVKTFSDLPEEIARRFIFGLIEKAAEQSGLYRGNGWQLFSPKSLDAELPNAYDAVNIDIRSEQEGYRIYLDPTLLILLPLTSVIQSQLFPDRPLIRIVMPSDVQRMEQWNHSSHPGWVGHFVGIDDDLSSASEPLAPDTAILIKRTRRAKEMARYPAFALRVIATREEVESLGLTRQQRRKTQPLPYFRLVKTKEWADKLFPNNTLVVNDREIPIENRIAVFESPSCYPDLSKRPYLWYPETQLLFNPVGNKTHVFQIMGLKKYGPFDQSSPTRPFQQIRPYLIVLDDPHLIQLSAQFFKFLADGYEKRKGADYPDDDFDGISPTTTFRVKFIPPGDEDIIPVDGSKEAYEEAAKEILRRWTIKENRSDSRIVVVIVPNLYDAETDGSGYDGDADENGDDPYLGLKRILVEGGLPSQMIEVSNLKGVEDGSVAFGHLLWTFALDLYVKMGGKPWTLLRPMSNVNCLIGLGFGINRQVAQNPIYIGVANVFDEGGQWLSLTSGDRELTDEDLLSIENREYGIAGTSSYKLHQELTQKIISESLSVYATPSPHRTATKVVLHKNGRVYESEALGFLQAFSKSLEEGTVDLSAARFALVSIYKNHHLRMYGPDYPNSSWPMRNTITRGSVYILNENTALVATTGKSNYSYPGIGTPRPILVERFVPTTEALNSVGFDASQMYSIEEICEQVLALTKLHWGTTRNIRLPVTSEYAQRIASFIARSKVRVDLLLKWKKLWWI